MPKYAPPRSGQDLNPFMTCSPLTMPHYANTNSPTYNYTLQPRHGEYSPLYSAYATTFISSQTEELQCLSKHLQMTPQYPYNTSILGSTASPHRPLAQATPCSIQQLSSHPFSQGLRYSNHHDLFQLPEVESQDSVNESTMRSEPVLPPLSGFPDVRDFDRLVNRCVLVLLCRHRYRCTELTMLSVKLCGQSIVQEARQGAHKRQASEKHPGSSD